MPPFLCFNSANGNDTSRNGKRLYTIKGLQTISKCFVDHSSPFSQDNTRSSLPNLWHVKIGHSRSQLITVLIEIFQFRFANISACHRCLTLLAGIPMLSFTTSQNLTKRLTLFHGSSTQTMGNWLLEKFDGLLWHVWCGSDSAMSCLKSLPRNSHEVIFYSSSPKECLVILFF